MKKKSISCNEKFIFSEIDFANGITRNIIQGKLDINDSLYSFNMILDSNNVIDYVFPFLDKDSINYNCSFKIVNRNVIELEWKKGNRRLFLSKPFTSVR